MKKRILSFVLVVVMMLSVLQIPIMAANYTWGQYTYTVSNSKATITKGDASISGNLVIPSSIGGYPVFAIGDDAFANNGSITSVTIPSSVSEIGSSAFSGCVALTNVNFGNSVEKIWGDAFCNCEALTGITFPDTLKIIGDRAFENCASITSVTIPSSVTNIGKSAFGNCDSLKTVAISGENLRVYDYIFRDCNKLETATIGNGVNKIEYGAFKDCNKLTSVTISNDVTKIGTYTFDGCSALKNVYYGGTSSEWNEIAIFNYNDELTNATIHYNQTIPEVVEKSAQENKTAYSLSISPSSGFSNMIIGKDQYGSGIYQDGTGTLFTFTAVTSSNVNTISICGDKPDETQWHEISYEYLKNNYGLYSYDNGNGTKTWVCQFYINEPNHATMRTFKVKVDGIDTNAVAYVNVTAQNTLANDTKVDLPTQGGGFGNQQETSVTVNGKKVNFDVPPQIINGRTMIPVRAVAEAFGATVDWDQNRGVATIRGYNKYKGAIRICYIEIGSNSMYWEDDGAWLYGGNGGYKDLDSPAVIIEGRTLVPIRAIAEVFGYDVEWDNEKRTVVIEEFKEPLGI